MPQSNIVKLKVQGLSGFDKSHYHDLSANVGSLVPVLTDELIPHSICNLNVAASVQLPPLASDAFAKIDLKLEAFAIPLRILFGGFEKWFTDSTVGFMDYEGPSFHNQSKIPYLPYFTIGTNWDNLPSVFGRCTLTDYLGCKVGNEYFHGGRISLLPFLAYHKIYDEWYRAPLVQTQVFSDGIDVDYADDSNYVLGCANLPFIFGSYGLNFAYEYDSDNNWMYFADGSTIFNLRQRNYGFDYFTNAWPTLQFGDAQSVQVSDGKITIAALRAANSLQQFEERNNFAPRYYQAIKARYGCDVGAGVVQRPIFLGSATVPIKSYGVDVTAANVNGGDPNRNPYADSAGAQLGRARGEGFVNLVDNYKVNEPSYLMVIASIVPRAVYSSGVSRFLNRYVFDGGLTDMANPLLQNTGNQPIYGWELNGQISGNRDYAFGYTDRYADFMTCPDRISGELREGGSLESFVLKRDFENRSVGINSSFLSIPTTALDEISATDAVISHYGAWMQFGFDYKVVQPLALYSIPSLQDPAYEHGNDIEIYRGGFRF